MDRNITFMQYGCGKMSRYLMRYIMGKGGQLQAAFDINPSVIGKDVSEIIGNGYPHVGVEISDVSKADELMKIYHPDVCVIATRSTVAELEEIFTICAKNGVNAITTCEEALYPWNSSPALTQKLDKLAKKGNCTLTGVGYCDLFWGTMVTNLCGSSYEIKKITGSSWYNVEDYGIALAEGHGVGYSLDRFEQEIGKYNGLAPEKVKELVECGEIIPSYMWNQNGWLCSRMGLTIVSQTQKCLPCVEKIDLYSSTLGRTIKAGVEASGMRAVVTTVTKEGIIFETECVGKVFTKEEYDKNEWALYGEPDTIAIVNKPATVELTCATILNRIPQLIDAPAGYVTTDRYPYNIFCLKNLHEYVQSK